MPFWVHWLLTPRLPEVSRPLLQSCSSQRTPKPMPCTPSSHCPGAHGPDVRLISWMDLKNSLCTWRIYSSAQVEYSLPFKRVPWDTQQLSLVLSGGNSRHKVGQWQTCGRRKTFRVPQSPLPGAALPRARGWRRTQPTCPDV